MNIHWTTPALAWITRVLSILFVAMNAWGWWDESRARQEPMNSGGSASGASTDFFWQWAVFTHLLPLIVIVVATVLGWVRPMYGVIGFGLFAVLQIVSIGTEWIYFFAVAVIPLAITALYLVGWVLTRRAQSRAR